MTHKEKRLCGSCSKTRTATTRVSEDNTPLSFCPHLLTVTPPTVHLHGHHFQLLYKGSETDYSIGLYRQAVHEYNTGTGTPPDIWRRFSAGIGYQLQQTQSSPANPMTRDTLMAEKYQFTVVAFVADNPGVWALHCHNDFHARSGMFKQVVEMPSRLVENLGTWARDASAPDGFRYTPPVNRTWSEDGAVLASWKRNLEQCAASGGVF